jgi:hypothetical protein
MWRATAVTTTFRRSSLQHRGTRRQGACSLLTSEEAHKKAVFPLFSVKSAVASAVDGGGGLVASNSSSGAGADAAKLSAPASGVDASIVALPYWSAFFGNAGTLALNPCGGIQNLHNDCPVDARGDPTNSFVQLRSSVAPGLSPLDHRAAHCVGWGTSASMQFADADDTHAGFKIQISQGTDGRSATLHFVCGRSLGEITAFAPSGDGPGASATLTFVTKYACPKSSDADAELERQRRKEADRKARQKLQQNYASLKQARLSPQQAEAAATPAAAAAAAAAAALSAAGKRFAASPGAPNKGFAKMRELGLHSSGGRSIDALMEAERRKREHQQFADSFDADEPIDEAPQRPPQIVVEQYVAPPPPSPVQQQEPQQQEQPAVQAKVFARREGRPDSQAKDSVSLDVYQQLLAKMREKAAKQGVSAEEAAHKSAQAQARVESDPLRLQLRRRDDAEQAVEDDRDVESEAPDPMRALDEDVDDDVDTDQLEKIHARMRQKADVLRQGAQTLASAKDLRRSIGDVDQAAPRKRDAPPEKSVLTSLLASPEFGNQLLLVLLLLVASALGIAWYRVKQQEHAAIKAAAAQEVLGGGGNKVFTADSPGSHKTSGRVYEYDATSDFEARSTKYTYERFVAELASKSNAPVTEADELDADDVLGSLLPPAPSASSGAGSSGSSSSSSLDAFSNGLSRRARSPDTETTNKSD